MTGILGQALAYASIGWPVFPCRPDQGECPYLPTRKCECKAPLGQAVPHGCLDATTDPERIRAWWAQLAARQRCARNRCARARRPRRRRDKTGRPATQPSAGSSAPGLLTAPAPWSAHPAGAPTSTTPAPARDATGCAVITSTSRPPAGMCSPRQHHPRRPRVPDPRPAAQHDRARLAGRRATTRPAAQAGAQTRHMGGRGTAGWCAAGTRRRRHRPVKGPAPAGRRLRTGRHERDRHPPARRELPARPGEVRGPAGRRG